MATDPTLTEPTDLPDPDWDDGPDDRGCDCDEAGVPAELVELHEILEWEASVQAAAEEEGET